MAEFSIDMEVVRCSNGCDAITDPHFGFPVALEDLFGAFAHIADELLVRNRAWPFLRADRKGIKDPFLRHDRLQGDGIAIGHRLEEAIDDLKDIGFCLGLGGEGEEEEEEEDGAHGRKANDSNCLLSICWLKASTLALAVDRRDIQRKLRQSTVGGNSRNEALQSYHLPEAHIRLVSQVEIRR